MQGVIHIGILSFRRARHLNIFSAKLAPKSHIF
jgi:hypothetical protein